MITASIVLYESNILELRNLLDFISNNIPDLRLIIVDNSKVKNKNVYISGNINIKYFHQPSNPGFGAAHNIAIKYALSIQSKFHFVINPDIKINSNIFSKMIEFMKDNPDVGMMMPKVLNYDGSIQFLPKLLPNFFWILRRKARKIDPLHKKFINIYELRDYSNDIILNVPILSGCFSLLRMDAIIKIGMYDERFFMYFEDFDLSRRIHKKYKTIYFPDAYVFHGYQAGANKNLKLFLIYIASMLKYFNKWGWFFDKDRNQMNKIVLNKFNL